MDSNELNLLLEFAKRFNELIEQRAQELVKSAPKDTFMSPAVDELAKAMSVAQGEYLPLFFNKTNPYERWEFNDLESIMSAVRPSLSKNGLFFTQLPCVEDAGATIVYTRLIHSSGQWIECRSRVIPSKNNQHEFDSVLMFQGVRLPWLYWVSLLKTTEQTTMPRRICMSFAQLMIRALILITLMIIAVLVMNESLKNN